MKLDIEACVATILQGIKETEDACNLAHAAACKVVEELLKDLPKVLRYNSECELYLPPNMNPYEKAEIARMMKEETEVQWYIKEEGDKTVLRSNRGELAHAILKKYRHV